MNDNVMQQATDSINMQDDKLDGGMGLSNSMGLSETGSTIDLERPNYGYQHDTGQGTQDATQEEDKSDYDPLEKEEKQTQGEYERELQNIREETENIRDDLDILKTPIKDITDFKTYNNLLNKYGKYLDKSKNYKSFDQAKEDVINGMEKELTTLYDREYEIMNSGKDEYDPRDYGETREDNLRKEAQEREEEETSRAVEAMRKAGLNPATLSGNISYGGGGGISSGSGKSSDEEDEEKRRKRKREEEAARLRAEAEKKRQNQQMVMQIISMLGGIGGTLGAAAIRNNALRGMAEVRGQASLQRNRESAYHRLQRDARMKYENYEDIDYWKYGQGVQGIEEMGGYTPYGGKDSNKYKKRKKGKNEPDWLDDYIKNF